MKKTSQLPLIIGILLVFSGILWLAGENKKQEGSLPNNVENIEARGYVESLDLGSNQYLIETKNDEEKKKEKINNPETQEEQAKRLKEAEESRLRKITYQINLLELLIEDIPNQDFSKLNGQDFRMISAAVERFSIWAEKIKTAKNSKHKEIRDLGAMLEEVAKRKQSSAFPQLRKAYGTHMGKALWENDVTVKVYGSSNNIIEFTGGQFAANRTIKEAHLAAKEAMLKLRFDQANYKWYKYDDEYTYSKLDSALDTEIK